MCGRNFVFMIRPKIASRLSLCVPAVAWETAVSSGDAAPKSQRNTTGASLSARFWASTHVITMVRTRPRVLACPQSQELCGLCTGGWRTATDAVCGSRSEQAQQGAEGVCEELRQRHGVHVRRRPRPGCAAAALTELCAPFSRSPTARSRRWRCSRLRTGTTRCVAPLLARIKQRCACATQRAHRARRETYGRWHRLALTRPPPRLRSSSTMPRPPDPSPPPQRAPACVPRPLLARPR